MGRTALELKKAYIELLLKQIGYKEDGTNITKYGKYFDTPQKDGGAWQYFNTHKQGSEWCCLLNPHWLLCKLVSDHAKVRSALGEPSPKNNCGAGVHFLYNYMKKKGLIRDDKTKGEPGDLVFFNTKKAKCAHIGSVVELESGKYAVVEGNKSNRVKKCLYSKKSTTIYAIGRIPWDKLADAKEESKPAEKPKEEVKPADKKLVKATEPAESHDRYYARSWKVMTSGKILNMRNGAGTNYSVMVEIPNKATVQCYGYFTGSWIYVRYETSSKVYEGFCSKNYLK